MNYTFIMNHIRQMQEDLNQRFIYQALYHLRCVEGEILQEIEERKRG